MTTIISTITSHAPTPALKQYAPREQCEKDITNPPMNQPERLNLVVAPNNCLACQSPQDISPVVCNVSGMSLENKERERDYMFMQVR